jgi:hypothetical protein
MSQKAERKEQKNDERSQYIIENKGLGLQTNPNEANSCKSKLQEPNAETRSSQLGTTPSSAGALRVGAADA